MKYFSYIINYFSLYKYVCLCRSWTTSLFPCVSNQIQQCCSILNNFWRTSQCSSYCDDIIRNIILWDAATSATMEALHMYGSRWSTTGVVVGLWLSFQEKKQSTNQPKQHNKQTKNKTNKTLWRVFDSYFLGFLWLQLGLS